MYPATQHSPAAEPGLHRAAWGLSLAGALPFLAAALSTLIGHASAPLWADWSLLYGIAILAFLGAIHWGAVLMGAGGGHRAAGILTLGTAPALYGLVAAFLPTPLGDLWLAGGFALAFALDCRLAGKVGYPMWFRRLRAVLTIVVTSALLIIAAAL